MKSESKSFYYRPSKDTYWAFRTSYIENLDLETFFPKFCDEFEDDFDDNDEITILPVGLCTMFVKCSKVFKQNELLVANLDDAVDKIEDITLKSLDYLEKHFKDKKWWNYFFSNAFNENLSELEKVEFQSFFGKNIGVKDSIIFWVKGGTLDDIQKVKNFLSNLNFHDGLMPLGVANFEIAGKGVSVFEYD